MIIDFKLILFQLNQICYFIIIKFRIFKIEYEEKTP